jgi:hypothetical protein
MPRPLPDRTPTAEGVQYRLQKNVDEAVQEVIDNLSFWGKVTEDIDADAVIFYETGGKTFRIIINYQVEVEEHAQVSEDHAGSEGSQEARREVLDEG